MKSCVVVVDYGMGNLFSVTKAFEACGTEAVLSSDLSTIAAAEKLVLPGVGAFSDGMAGLERRGLAKAIQGFVAKGGPLLGICLGMQLLMDESDEFGVHCGLGLMPGRVAAIPTANPGGKPRKVPHVGWNGIFPAGEGWNGTILEKTAPGASVYFVHSFAVEPAQDKHRLAESDHDGHRVVAAIRSGNVFGCQFHPEKSGPVGLSIIRQFINFKS